MKTAILSLAMLFAASANAEVIATAETEDPLAAIKLHDDAGPCKGDARKAEFAKINQESTYGCWVVRAGGYISIAWLDGDFDRIPVSSLNHDAL